MKLGDQAQNAAIEHVKHKAAREILKDIRQWRTNRILTAKRRWIFELIQNATDTAKLREKPSVDIEIISTPHTVKFKHNGGFFTLDEISAVIYGGSSKPYEPGSPLLGRFGSGLIVSHVVSRVFHLSGYIQDLEHGIHSFKTTIVRNSDDEPTISQSISRSFEELNSALKMRQTGHDLWTEFMFIPDDSLGREAITGGIMELEKTITLVLAFNPVIGAIRVNGVTFQKEEHNACSKDIRHIMVGGNTAYIKANSNPTVQIALLLRDGEVKSLADQPKIYLGMPLTETADYVDIPFAINSTCFEPTPEREGLTHTGENAGILSAAFEMYFDLVNDLCLHEEIADLSNIVSFGLVPSEAAKQNPLWNAFNEKLIHTWKKVLTEIPLVPTYNGFLEVKNTLFPSDTCHGRAMPNDHFVQFCGLLSRLHKNTPLDNHLEPWIHISNRLVIPQLADCISRYSFDDMRRELDKFVESEENFPPMEDFQAHFGIQDSHEFLHSFYSICNHLYSEDVIDSKFIEKLIPDQSGVIGPIKWGDSRLYLDNELPEEFKDVTEKIGWNVRQHLVDKDYSSYDIVINAVNEAMDLDTALQMLINKREIMPKEDALKDEPWDELTLGWIELFRWCILNGKLPKEFPLITKDLNIKAMHDPTEAAFLVPFRFMGIEEKFEVLYPGDKIIHYAYFSDHLEDLLVRMEQYSVFVTKIPAFRDKMTIGFNKLRSILRDHGEVSRVEHKVDANREMISVLPFWSDVIGKVSSYENQAKLLFRFVICSLLDRDDSWQRCISVCCTCKSKRHDLLACHWLASLKSDQWVPVRITVDEGEDTVPREATPDNLRKLFSPEEMEELLQFHPERTAKFLLHFGFDELDLRIKLESLARGKSEDVLRREVSGLVPLVSIIPDLSHVANMNIDMLRETIKKLKARLDNEVIKDENRVVGKAVERIIGRLLKYLGLGTRPRVMYVGGDIEIWPDSNEGFDAGQVTFSPYIAEIKFTTGHRVHLSRSQSEMSRIQKDRYLVVVVQDPGGLRDILKAEISKDQIDTVESFINENSYVVQNIGSKLGNIPNPDEVEPDINGYWIKEKLWTKQCDLYSWVERKFPESS